MVEADTDALTILACVPGNTQLHPVPPHSPAVWIHKVHADDAEQALFHTHCLHRHGGYPDTIYADELTLATVILDPDEPTATPLLRVARLARATDGTDDVQVWAGPGESPDLVLPAHTQVRVVIPTERHQQPHP